jgi:hypothetical protein
VTVLARGQAAWLRAAGRPTRRVDALASAPAVSAARVIVGATSAMLQDLRFEGVREVLVCRVGALGPLEHGDMLVHDGVRVLVLSGPMPVPPDTGLEAWSITGGVS